jgi:hypothetical protein
VELDYAKYVEGQKLLCLTLLKKGKKLSMPFIKKVNGYFRLNYSQLVYGHLIITFPI